MTARTLDAALIAQRMNARPLGPDCDGGEWFPTYAYLHILCSGCEGVFRDNAPLVSCGTLTLCLPCAVADCERAESDAAHRAHAAADPHCTCNDCMADHIAGQEGGAL